MKLLRSRGADVVEYARHVLPGEYTNEWFDVHIRYWATLDEWAWAQRADHGGLRWLEIGTYEGRSAMWLMSNLVEPADVGLTVVDPWGPGPEWQPIYERAMRNLNDAKVCIKRKTSLEFWASDGNDQDFVYVDGSHKAAIVAEDVRCAWRRLRKGGIVLVDDFYSPNTPDTERVEVETGLLEVHSDFAWTWPPPRFGAAVLYQKVES